MIESLLDRVERAGPASGVVLESGNTRISRSEFVRQVKNLARCLRRKGFNTIALHADNGVAWVLSDLACQLARIRVVPVPLFFSAAQIEHAMTSSGADALISDQPCSADHAGNQGKPLLDDSFADPARIFPLAPRGFVSLPPDTQKITFTSGTTGTPKGVCLSADQQFAVAASLKNVIRLDKPRHLCVLPLGTLLENLAGVYAPLLAGGTVTAPRLDSLGLQGSSALETRKLLDCISRYKPNSLILVPEMLNELAIAAASGWRPPSSLKFVAVGGGKVASAVLRRARRFGIPAFEGYGLSECASVVSLNVPGADRTGSVGRPLPHLRVDLQRGEIVVSGNAFLGYVNQPGSWRTNCVGTGDLGHIDTDGFIHIGGRAKSQLISSFGRNIAPEWIESELVSGPLIRQAIVFGDARPFCVALLRPRDASIDDQRIAAWIDEVNRELPDYARVQRWRRMPQPFHGNADLQTSNTRPTRKNIERTYRVLIDSMYETAEEVCNA